jgi:serine protease Do
MLSLDSTRMGIVLNRLRGLGAVMAALLALAGGTPVAAQPAKVVPSGQEQLQLSFAPLVKRVAPAVVNIYTKKTVRAQPSPLLNDPFFRRFFGDQIPPPSGRVQNSLGSGVIVDPTGIIITNNHVIRGADEIIVAFADRREFEATLLRADERTDLAVLKIEIGDEKLPALELRDSDELEVGDLVLAIGNPFGVGQTVTSGIVSAVARTMAGIADYRFFIQTDAAINPGNSGGALVAMDGRLVGVNTAIYSRDGGSIGIGFAIPSNMVRTVLNGVTAGGKLVRPWLGAAGQTVTPDIASSLGLMRPSGVLVNELYPGSPAERAGLRRGDVVTHVEGREVGDSEALRFRIALQPVGTSVKLTVWRDGKDRVVPISLIAPPETPPRESTPLRGTHPLAGATIANLSPALADELGLDVGPRGVIILELRRGSPAQSIRLLPGDLLLRINDRELKNVEDVRKATTQVNLPWRVVLKRGERLINFTVGG